MLCVMWRRGSTMYFRVLKYYDYYYPKEIEKLHMRI
jgi:hypothetical protein